MSICCNFARNLYLFEFALDFLTNGKTMITIPYVLVNEVPLGLERANIPVPLSKSYQRKNCCFKVLCRRFYQKTNPTNSAFFFLRYYQLFLGYSTNSDGFRRRVRLWNLFIFTQTMSFQGIPWKKNGKPRENKTKNQKTLPWQKGCTGYSLQTFVFFDFLKVFSFF